MMLAVLRGLRFVPRHNEVYQKPKRASIPQAIALRNHRHSVEGERFTVLLVAATVIIPMRSRTSFRVAEASRKLFRLNDDRQKAQQS
jgi:hypothetical protein